MNPKLENAFHDLSDDAREKLEVLRKKSKVVDKYAHERPWAVVAIVALLSLIFGFLLGRQSKD